MRITFDIHRDPYVNGRRCEYLDCGSREVYWSEEDQIVVKVEPFHTTRTSGISQCVAEALTSSRAVELDIVDIINPTVQHGVVPLNVAEGRVMFWNTQPYLPGKVSYKDKDRQERKRLTNELSSRLKQNYIPDLGGSSQFRRNLDGQIKLVDYGVIFDPDYYSCESDVTPASKALKEAIVRKTRYMRDRALRKEHKWQT